MKIKNRFASRFSNSWQITILALLVAGNLSFAQEEDQSASLIIEKDVRVVTRAGDRVSVNIYRPDKEGRFPVLLSMGPYGKDALPARYSGTFGDGQIVVSKHAAFETPDPEYWVNYDYVVIAADSPGSNRSEGDLDILGAIEANAYYDVIEWAAAQPWSNGNVGLGGVSYYAMSQWYVAALNPPHLRAILPVEGFTDWYRDLIRHGGIPASFVRFWFENRVLPSKRPAANLVNDFSVAADEHPLIDDFWHGVLPDLGSITVPAYVVASWPDHGLHTRGTIIGFEQIASEQKWLEIHGRKKWEHYYMRDTLERQRRFFDHFLHGVDNGFENTPAIRYERRTRFYDGDTLYADTWPPAGMKPRRYYLGSDGNLSIRLEKNAAALSYNSVDAGDQLTFRVVFAEPTEVTGGARLRLWVETRESDDMDLFVGLSKLDRNGNEVLMSGHDEVEHGHLASGWLRVSHREVDKALSSETQPFLKHQREQKLIPGEKVSVEIEILPSSTFFDVGESLVLRIQGSELSGAGDIDHEDPLNRGTHIVHVGGDNDSYLVLPVVPF